MIVRMAKEELDKMCQEIIDSFDEETFLADKFVHLMSNCDLKIITAANVPENYKEEGHMRKHWQNKQNILRHCSTRRKIQQGLEQDANATVAVGEDREDWSHATGVENKQDPDVAQLMKIQLEVFATGANQDQ